MLPAQIIETIKSRTDLLALIGESVRLVRRGRSYVGLCPFHKEKSGSFHVSPERGFFHCYGCKESGDAVSFVVKQQGCTFREAMTVLAERLGIELEDSGTDAERREAAAARRERDDLYAINGLAAAFFEAQLWGQDEDATRAHPQSSYAWLELERRGFARASSGSSRPTIRAFRLGYAPASWDALTAFFRQQGISPIAAEKVGLLVPRQGGGGGHYDRFRHRLMFPVFDTAGRVVAFSGRALKAPPDADSVKPRDGEQPAAKYVNSPESPIYSKGNQLFGLWQARAAIRQANCALLVEGNFDVVSLHARGFGHAVAPLGTAFTTDQAKLLRRFAEQAVVLFDGDLAGQKATRAARGPCGEAALAARVGSLPADRDPDDLVRKEGAPALAAIIESAMGLLEYLIEEALDAGRFASASLQDRLQRVRQVAELLAEEKDPELRLMAGVYADRIAGKLGDDGSLSVQQLEQMIRKRLSDAGSQGAAPAAEAPPDPLHLAVLGAAADHPELLHEEAGLAAMDAVDGAVALALGLLASGAPAAEVAGRAPPSLRDFLARRLTSPEHESLEEGRAALFANTALLLRRRAAHRKEELLAELGRTRDAARQTAILAELTSLG